MKNRLILSLLLILGGTLLPAADPVAVIRREDYYNPLAESFKWSFRVAGDLPDRSAVELTVNVCNAEGRPLIAPWVYRLQSGVKSTQLYWLIYYPDGRTCGVRFDVFGPPRASQGWYFNRRQPEQALSQREQPEEIRIAPGNATAAAKLAGYRETAAQGTDASAAEKAAAEARKNGDASPSEAVRSPQMKALSLTLTLTWRVVGADTPPPRNAATVEPGVMGGSGGTGSETVRSAVQPLRSPAPVPSTQLPGGRLPASASESQLHLEKARLRGDIPQGTTTLQELRTIQQEINRQRYDTAPTPSLPSRTRTR